MLPVILSNDPTYIPTTGDVHIENTRAPKGDGIYVIDPQHGAHRPGVAWPAVEPGDAACTYALRLSDSTAGEIRRIVLTPQAGLDDYLAAAILTAGDVDWLEHDGRYRKRMAQVAALDNVGFAKGAPWALGVHTSQVDEGFPGLGRLVKVRADPAWKVRKIMSWLTQGVIVLTADERVLLGMGDFLSLAFEDKLPALDALDALAKAKRQDYVDRCSVIHVQEHVLVCIQSPAPTNDPSEGQGGFGLGYQYAPFVVAYYPLDDAATRSGPVEYGLKKFTIGRHSGAGMRWSFSDLVERLNATEAEAGGDPTWGGNPASGILGSPRGGSRLEWRGVAEIVLSSIEQ